MKSLRESPDLFRFCSFIRCGPLIRALPGLASGDAVAFKISDLRASTYIEKQKQKNNGRSSPK
jgi:hypothetical protein